MIAPLVPFVPPWPHSAPQDMARKVPMGTMGRGKKLPVTSGQQPRVLKLLCGGCCLRTVAPLGRSSSDSCSPCPKRAPTALLQFLQLPHCSVALTSIYSEVRQGRGGTATGFSSFTSLLFRIAFLPHIFIHAALFN